MKIDAHQHFWELNRGDYGWLTQDLEPIYKDFQPKDLAPHLQTASIDGSILVQAAPTLAETEYLLDIASKHDFVKGVVGWVDFESPNSIKNITRLSKNPLLIGLRPMIQNIDDPEWMLHDRIKPALELMSNIGLTFDALILPKHLPVLKSFIDKYPKLAVVINHGAKPQIRQGNIESWAQDITTIAKNSSAFCKLSGLITEASPNRSEEKLRPYIDVLLSAFGPHRLIWGSDWPVCTMATSYNKWHELSCNLLKVLTQSQREAVYGGNACRAYNMRLPE